MLSFDVEIVYNQVRKKTGSQYICIGGYDMKNILFVASEGVPFIKTGGLADVVGSLPKCIDREYYDVRVILPKYNCMHQNKKDMQKNLNVF